METGAGGEEGGAEELDGAEGRAARNEVHLIFVGTREEREAFGFSRPEDTKRNQSQPLPSLLTSDLTLENRRTVYNFEEAAQTLTSTRQTP